MEAPTQMPMTTHSLSPKTAVFLESSSLRNPPLQNAIFALVSLSTSSSLLQEHAFLVLRVINLCVTEKGSSNNRGRRPEIAIWEQIGADRRTERGEEREKRRDLISLMAAASR